MCLLHLYGMGYVWSEVTMGSWWCHCGVCHNECMVDYAMFMHVSIHMWSSVQWCDGYFHTWGHGMCSWYGHALMTGL